MGEIELLEVWEFGKTGDLGQTVGLDGDDA
jgi:hypothetical protein